MVEGVEIIGVSDIKETVAYLQGGEEARIEPTQIDVMALWEKEGPAGQLDFAQINGQEAVKRAAEVAAAGFHHLLMIGPPGSGKTMMARRIPSILPPLSLQESLEVSTIYSVSGLLQRAQEIFDHPGGLFLNPHHTITGQALAGGGRVPVPGMISLAHRGILFWMSFRSSSGRRWISCDSRWKIKWCRSPEAAASIRFRRILCWWAP